MVEENKKFNPPPAPSTPREAPWRELETISDTLNQIRDQGTVPVQIPGLAELIDSIRELVRNMPAAGYAPGESGGLEALARNRLKWRHFQEVVSSPGTAHPLPDMPVPDFFALIVRAKSSNSGNIYVGRDRTRASTSTLRVTLAPGEYISLKVQNASAIWIDGATEGDGVECFTESDT